MVKKGLTGLLAFLLPLMFMQAHLSDDKDVNDKKRAKMERAVSTLPDSAYEQVCISNLHGTVGFRKR